MTGRAEPLRIAMWSGPRNISTAMMRAFENRADSCVIDEPFYAAYLARTGLNHPMRNEIMASQPHGSDAVIASLLGPVPDNARVFYQKHMTQHMLPDIPLEWLASVANCFLIREPDAIVASYLQKRARVTEADLGLKRQFELFQKVCDLTGGVPPVINASDVLKDPRRVLARLCDRVGIPFTEDMLTWPVGRRTSDGVWAQHWYQSVEASTGFTPWQQRNVDLPAELSELVEDCQGLYRRLKTHAL